MALFHCKGGPLDAEQVRGVTLGEGDVVVLGLRMIEGAAGEYAWAYTGKPMMREAEYVMRGGDLFYVGMTRR